MKNIKFFHLGQFFGKRALIATLLGAGLAVVTEYVLPKFGILAIPAIQSWITPATITFTLAVIIIFSAIAKNLVASIFIGTAAILSFYSPYIAGIYDYGFWSVVIIYLVTAFFSGLFAAIEMSGRTALLVVGIVYGIQGFIGAGTSMFLSLTNMQQPFLDNNLGIAFGETMGSFPLYDVIVGGFSFIFMLVFIILSRRRYSIDVDNKKREIIGQIIIFLAIVGAILFIVLSNVMFDQTSAELIFGEKNTRFMNLLFAKNLTGGFMAIRLLNVFYILPIVGFAIGIGMLFIIHGRAEGTTGHFRMNFEGPLLLLNVVPFLIIAFYSYPVQRFFAGDAPVTNFYLEMPTWFTLFTEYTSLLLINLLVAYIIFKIVSLIRNLIQKK
ncbi:MAG: hypothetical protein GPJ51_03810 [Candidatus Heimdallarchaeota archaeon]|nr:hypothetical protein [Candidatus Heimdallarchaeota archaeon]